MGTTELLQDRLNSDDKHDALVQAARHVVED